MGLINNNLIINHMIWVSKDGVYAVTSLNPTVSACEKAGMSKIRTRLMQMGLFLYRHLTLARPWLSGACTCDYTFLINQ